MAQQTEADAWQVTLDVQAQKVMVDEAGIKTEVPMNDWIAIGVFGESESYVQQHLVRSGKQAITVTVAQMPDRAGIDPRHLLSDLGEIDVNIKTVKIGN